MLKFKQSWMRMIFLSVIACMLSPTVFATNTSEDIQTLINSLAKRKPAIKVEAKDIQESPIPGLYSVLVAGKVVYLDKDAKYVFLGNLIENATKKNLTEARRIELTTIDFNTLPFKNAIKIKKGNGKATFAIFSDPDCPFCQQIEKGMHEDGMTNYTAYVFLYPLENIHPQARKKAESIWCAKDKNAAWFDWMTKKELPQNKGTCKNPIGDNIKLAEKLGLAGTPTIYLSNGLRTQDTKLLFQHLTGREVQHLK